MTAMELIEQVKARRKIAGLNVIMDGKLFSFATIERRDDFMMRAERAGHKVEIQAKQYVAAVVP
jgi:hypothetical protein